MSTLEVPTFLTPQEEIMYWKKAVEEKQQEVDDLEQSFAEYQEFSKQLEEEMEGELRACEKKYAELQSQHAGLKNDYETIQDRLNNTSRESSTLITSLQDEVSKLAALKQSLLQDKRKLEQENDTLERRERASSASAQDLTEKLDRVMEENVWIQSELEENKQEADETIQRLREDIRDLRQELSARERKSNLIISKPVNSEKSKRENPMSFHIPRPHKSQRQRAEDTPTTGATSSLSVVSELINLVSDLENKITHFRTSSIPSSSNSKLSNSPPKSPMASPLLKPSNSIANFNFQHSSLYNNSNNNNNKSIPFPSLNENTESSNNSNNNNTVFNFKERPKTTNLSEHGFIMEDSIVG